MKAFQIFSTKKNTSLKDFSTALYCPKLKATVLCLLYLFSAGSIIPAEESSLSMPSMPEISGPSLSMPSMPQIQPHTEQPQQKTPAETANAKTSGQTVSGTKLTASTLSKLSSESGLGTISSLLGGNSLNGLSSLYGTETSLNAAQGLLTNSTGDSVLLAEILEKLNSIAENLEKNGNTSSAAAETSATQTASGAAAENADKKEPAVYKGDFSISKFKVCGHNLLSSFKEIYFSSPEEDGSFLLSIDRSYSDGSRPRSETVYLFFAPDKSSEKGKFQLTIELMQDFENPNSFLYRLKESSPYNVKKTGNTYSLISKSKDFSAELLITQK